MSGRYRTYRGIHGERIRVPEASFATVLELHAEAQPFPFARMAAALGPLRDRFAHVVNQTGLFEEAMLRGLVQRLLAHVPDDKFGKVGPCIQGRRKSLGGW